MMASRPDFREHMSENNEQTAVEMALIEEKYRWQGVTALILGILSIYFLLVPLLNVVLALLAISFGAWGLRARHKTASVAGLAVGIVNMALIVIVTLAVIFAWWLTDESGDEHQKEAHSCGCSQQNAHQKQRQDLARDEYFYVYSGDPHWRH